MNMKQAHYVCTIAKAGTITAAAKQLYISQPSLSQTLHQIEQEAGIALFDRSSVPFRLTYAGERYLKAMEEMMEIEAKLRSDLNNIRNENTGRLRLGISVTRAVQVLPDLLPIFHREYPGVTLELKECPSISLEELLANGQIDLALAATEAKRSNISYELIETESMGILAGHGSALSRRIPSGTPITLKEAENDSFVFLESSHSSRQVQDKLFRRSNFRPNVLLETSSLEVARRVALRAGACILLPDVYIDDYIQQSGGCFYPLADYDNHRHFYACWRSSEQLPKYARSLIAITTSVLAKSPQLL